MVGKSIGSIKKSQDDRGNRKKRCQDQISARPFPAAVPGTSSHEAGFSFDIPKALLDGPRGGQLIKTMAENGFVRDVMKGQPLGDVLGDDPIHFTHSTWSSLTVEQQLQAITNAQVDFGKLQLPKRPRSRPSVSAARAGRPECN